jgi:hypothetical protein
MAAAPVLEPLIAAGVTATLQADGRLAVSPAARITPVLDAYIRAHRDELVAALTTPAPLDWPPAQPAWFAQWMREDDARRVATINAAMRRKADAHHRNGGRTS